MKKRKFKRYADEGLVRQDEMTEEDAKKKGLEASKNEKVGFFERLRMGNIDNPKSEAYKRFGAGRGRAESIAPAPVVERSFNTPERIETSGFEGMGGMKARMPVGLQSAVEGAGVEETAKNLPVEKKIKQTTVIEGVPDYRPRKKVTETTKKVSKPQTKTGSGASGFGTDEKGIAQRRMQGLEKKGVDKKMLGAGLGMGAAALLGSGAMRRRAKEGTISPDNRPSSMGNRPRLMGIDPMMEGDLERMAGEGGPNFRKGGKAKAKPVMKYASGGMVGKASSRADGIAKRGKTKCKVY